MKTLKSVQLEGNKLSGPIPEELCTDMPQLTCVRPPVRLPVRVQLLCFALLCMLCVAVGQPACLFDQPTTKAGRQAGVDGLH